MQSSSGSNELLYTYAAGPEAGSNGSGPAGVRREGGTGAAVCYSPCSARLRTNRPSFPLVTMIVPLSKNG